MRTVEMSAHAKMALGSTLATVASLGIVLSLLLGWYETAGPWAFLLGFVNGLLAGLGATLAVAGLIEHRRGR